jgi:basic membrane lipoprotein Med (substrate-binding protein (PBP1-ABC) superfamily)
MDLIVSFLYADGDVLMTLCNIVSFVFGLEALAYLVGIVAGIAKTAKNG